MGSGLSMRRFAGETDLEGPGVELVAGSARTAKAGSAEETGALVLAEEQQEAEKAPMQARRCWAKANLWEQTGFLARGTEKATERANAHERR